jgi:hypothetical protein
VWCSRRLGRPVRPRACGAGSAHTASRTSAPIPNPTPHFATPLFERRPEVQVITRHLSAAHVDHVCRIYPELAEMRGGEFGACAVPADKVCTVTLPHPGTVKRGALRRAGAPRTRSLQWVAPRLSRRTRPATQHRSGWLRQSSAPPAQPQMKECDRSPSWLLIGRADAAALPALWLLS